MCCLGNCCHFYSICSVFGIAGFLCEDLQWVSSLERAGFVSGWLGTSLVVGRLVTAVPWGLAADRFGRRPCFLATVFFIGVGNLTFGFARRLKTALALRFLFLGALNGWVTVSSPIVSEIAGPGLQNDVNAYVLASGAAAQLLGPAAAVLSYGLFPQYPALGPSILGANLAALAFFAAYFWLPETLSSTKRPDDNDDKVSAAAAPVDVVTDADDEDCVAYAVSPRSNRRFRRKDGYDVLEKIVSNPLPLSSNRSFVLGTFIRACSGLALFATFDVVPLWAVASKSVGGADLDKRQIAGLLGLSAFLQFFINIFCVARILRCLGQRRGLRAANIAAALALLSLPFLGALLSPTTPIARVLGLAPLLALYYGAAAMSFNAVSAVVNNSTDDSNRGRANGLATTVEALGKASGPTLGATAFALSISTFPGLAGASITFLGLAAIQTISAITTLFLPDNSENPLSSQVIIDLTQDKQQQEQQQRKDTTANQILPEKNNNNNNNTSNNNSQ